MKTSSELKDLLIQIDRKGYPAYKGTKGQYRFENYILSIDHVQGDPFASPSKITLHVKGNQAGFPSWMYDEKHKQTALEDHLIRLMEKELDAYSFKAKGSGKSGLITISHCGQEVIKRSACCIQPKNGDLIVGIEVGFPANGRTINAKELIKILFDFLPMCVKHTLFYQSLNQKMVKDVIDLAVDQQEIRNKLKEMGLKAFVANGSILPRKSGISLKPMKDAVLFQSPKSLEVTLDLPFAGKISGMGVKKGITLIVGGGYHGKSTLLKALELGVYNHIKGDGREYVITDDTAVKIRAEDGRSIQGTDISLFIQNLPNKKDTVRFYTEDASGSTSQAANVIESMEAGTGLLLIDEDTSATNFMIRDELMQRVVNREKEPIIPFIERMEKIYQEQDISIVLVAGSSGAYFHISDWIIQMDQYLPKDVTELAKKEAEHFPLIRTGEKEFQIPKFHRKPEQNSCLVKDNRIKIKTMGKDQIQINKNTIDLHYVEQLIDSEQTRTLGYMLLFAEKNLFGKTKNMREVVDKLMEYVKKEGLSALTGSSTYTSVLAMPRRQEIFACFNRYRHMKLQNDNRR